MVAHLLRLRFDLLLGALRGEPLHVLRAAGTFLLVAAATVVASMSALTLPDASATGAAVVTIFAGAALTSGFALAPLISGATDPLDPRRFTLFALSPRSLAAMIPVAGLISVPVAAVAVLAVCTASAWRGQGAPVWAVVASVVLVVATIALVVRVSMAVGALVLRERRSRELSGLFVVVLLVVVVPVVVFLSSLEWDGAVPSQLVEASHVLALTPVGAAWAVPAQALAGDVVPALLVAVLTVVVLAGAWALLVRALMTTTPRPVSVRERGGLGWFLVTPGNATGAIAARSVMYWFRDRRYAVNVLVIPIAALLTTVPLLVAGVPPEIVALVPVPIIALFFGWLPHNDLAYDSTALWLHIASGVRGIADRIGRLAPIVLIAVPTLAIAVPFAIAVHGRWATLPAMVGLCASLFLSGLGLSSIASVVAPYPVSRPGDSPFQQPQRTGASAVFAQALVMIGAIAFSAPALWWGWLTLTDDESYAESALWGGIGTGVLVFAVGAGIGAAVFDRRGGRLMEFAEAT